jgi:dTDP-4-amino-4,6-dideoxygalactose transaminase
MRPTLPAPERWLPYLQPAYDEHWFANGGPAAKLLERRLTETNGSASREAVAVASGTAGLVATLIALGARGPVVLPSFTFAATAHAVVLAGCEPVFCEVDPLTWELDPEHLRHTVRAVDAAAVVHVRAFGLCRDLTEIEDACAGVPLVVDSAAALRGRDERGRAAGGAGVAEVFSLHATKTVGIGEGGVVVAESSLVPAIRSAINFGFDGDGIPAGRGLNGKLAEPSAAIALAALDEADERIERRRSLAAAWAESVPLCRVFRAGDPAWPTQPLLLPGGWSGDEFVDLLAQSGVQARRYYRPALHRTPAFRTAAHLPVTDSLAHRMVCVPVYDDAEPHEVEELTAIVAGALRAAELPVAA